MGGGSIRGWGRGGLAVAVAMLVAGAAFGAEGPRAAGAVKVVQGAAWVERTGAGPPRPRGSGCGRATCSGPRRRRSWG